jgi:hypothetical protein
MIDGIRGRVCFTTGPTLRLYRVHAPGTPTGFSQPFASSAEPRSPALSAFDGQPSVWKPAKGQAKDAFVGFDFGHGGEREFTKIRIEWARVPPYPLAVEFQYAEFGGEWRSAGVFRVRIRVSGADAFSEHRLPHGIGAHRLWRMQLRGVGPDADVAIREVRFGEARGEAASSGASQQQASGAAPSDSETDEVDTPSLTERLFAGTPAKLVFDETACRRHRFRTLRCNSEYDVRYDAPTNRWAVTGRRGSHQEIVTWTSDAAEQRPGLMAVRGITYAFDDRGDVFFLGEKVGTIRTN